MRIPLTNVSAAMCIDAVLRYWDLIDAQWPGVINTNPDQPDDLIRVRDTGGVTQGRIQRGGEAIIKHGFQIMVRSDTDLAFKKCKDIENALLLGVRLLTIPVEDFAGNQISVQLTNVKLISPTTFISVETNNLRRYYSLNALLTAMEIH